VRVITSSQAASGSVDWRIGLDDTWRHSSALLLIPRPEYFAGLAAYRNMLTLRRRSISHTEATTTMLNEPAPSTSRG